jgi:AcrR family transcriptional regulator
MPAPADSPAHSRRKRRPARREAILDAAIDLFYERGYEATGIDEIGSAVGITGPGVYRHFKNKDEILDAALRRGISQIVNRAEEIIAEGGDPRSTLQLLVQNHLRAILNRPALASLVMAERRSLPARTRSWFDRADRLYTAEWIHLVGQIHPDLSEADIHLMVSAAQGVLVSAVAYQSGLPRQALEALLTEMAMALLVGDLDKR